MTLYKPELQELKDPVCVMNVTDQSTNVFNFSGKDLYFCSAGCKAKFSENSSKYMVTTSKDAKSLKVKPKATDPMSTQSIYTCPMHPEIRQDHAGVCPKCGMTLE